MAVRGAPGFARPSQRRRASLGLQLVLQYGSTLLALGNVDKEQGRHKEALAISGKAKAVLVHYKDGHE